MIVVADASVLVGELLRKRGRDLILHDALRVLVTEHQWSEAEHELRRRLDILVDRGRITAERRAELETDVLGFVKAGAIQSSKRPRMKTSRRSRATACPATRTTGRRSRLRSR